MMYVYDACSVIIALIQLTVFKLWLFDEREGNASFT